jgi:hypothetical protein
MSIPLFLFCGGVLLDNIGQPKPLMNIRDGKSLIIYFLLYLERKRPIMPESITLLCDEDQEILFKEVLCGFSYPVPLRVLSCGKQASTFEKLNLALRGISEKKIIVQFGYPDIFFFGKYTEPSMSTLESDIGIHISAAPLTSRFPRLVVDIYSNEIKGISNHRSMVPANPLYVFGGDIWGRADNMILLIDEFLLQATSVSLSLEYDFFFWLINYKKMHSVMLYGDRIWIDSVRDIQNLLEHVGENA